MDLAHGGRGRAPCRPTLQNRHYQIFSRLYKGADASHNLTREDWRSYSGIGIAAPCDCGPSGGHRAGSIVTEATTNELARRRAALLLAAVQEFINTAAPVGSQQILSHYSLGVKGATIRNMMAELEEA